MRSRAEFYKFVDGLLREEFLKTCEFEELIRTKGASSKTSSKSFYVRRDILIAKLSRKVEADHSSINHFLSTLELFDQNMPISDDEADVDSETQSPAIPLPSPEVIDFNEEFLCIFCKANTKNILVRPCKHVISCLDCWQNYEKFEKEKGENILCPLCKMMITEFENIFI